MTVMDSDHYSPGTIPDTVSPPVTPHCPQPFGDTLTSGQILQGLSVPVGVLDQLLGVETAGGVLSNRGCPWVVTATLDVGPGSDTVWLLPPQVMQRARSCLTWSIPCPPQVAPGLGAALGGR